MSFDSNKIFMYSHIVTCKDILVVLVLYRCRLEDSKAYVTLLSNLTKMPQIFVYDNSPEPQMRGIMSNIQYTHDPNNGGLSIAYNSACKYAKENSLKWMLLLDQDTSFPQNAFEEYIKNINRYPEVTMIVPKHKVSTGQYLSPTKYRWKNSRLCDEIPSGLAHFKDLTPINSGTMLTVKSFIRVGGYCNKVFLDFSDIYFMEKYSKIYDRFMIMNLECLQDYSIDESNKDKLLSRFKLFLQCARNYPRETFVDDFVLFVRVIRRCVHLFYITRDFKTIILFCQYYFK